MTIFGKRADLALIKFPIFLPIIYLTILFSMPAAGPMLALATMIVLAEPHFGATWTIFSDHRLRKYASSRKIAFVGVSVFLVLISAFLFIFVPSVFYLLFFALNVYHVTRQSVGVCKLYSRAAEEKEFQERMIYIFNSVAAFGAIAYLMLKAIDKETAFMAGIAYLVAVLAIAIYQQSKYKNLENTLTTVTGLIIFAPAFFVNKPIHAILAGVTMHYSQYICFTLKLYAKKAHEKPGQVVSAVLMRPAVIGKFFLVIAIYGVLAALLTYFFSDRAAPLKYLILIPMLGQILHFYLDGLLWRFSRPELREFNLKYLIS